MHHYIYKVGDTLELTVGRLEVRRELTIQCDDSYIPHMSVNMTQPYRNAILIGNALIQRIINPDSDGREVALLTREWRELESMKREWRGVPRLSTHKLEEVAKGRIATAKRLSPSNALPPYDELDDAPTPAPVPSTPPDTTV